MCSAATLRSQSASLTLQVMGQIRLFQYCDALEQIRQDLHHKCDRKNNHIHLMRPKFVRLMIWVQAAKVVWGALAQENTSRGRGRESQAALSLLL